jgi:hypothetical protein
LASSNRTGVIARQTHWPVLINPEAILLSCAFAGLVGITFGLSIATGEKIDFRLLA